MTNQDWNAALYDHKHAFVSQYGESIINLLHPQASERILDLGCGTGQLAHSIAATGAQVIGIDASPNMIAMARTNYPQLEFQVADASAFSFPDPFDAVFSNATLHWIRAAEAVVSRIAAALKPGGRFVAEFGGKGNVEGIISALKQAFLEVTGQVVDDGWYFPSIGTYTPLLEQYDLEVQMAHLFDRPTPLQDGEQSFRTWVEMFAGLMFQNTPKEVWPEIIALAEQKARQKLFRDHQWIADYRRLRIIAYKKVIVEVG